MTKKTESLVLLAANNLLPEFQYMDAETCKWIASHNPRYPLKDVPHTPDVDWLCSLTLPDEWFLEPNLLHTLHGKRHARRTAYYCLLIAAELGLDAVQSKLLAVAGLLHDLQRKNDKGDPGHAERSANWFRANTQLIASTWKLSLSLSQINDIVATIALHETPYKDFTAAQNRSYNKCPALIDALKTADALDRFRLPKLKWWIDDTHLRFIPHAQLKQLAYEIVLMSEQNFLYHKKDSDESVVVAIHEIAEYHTHYSTTWPAAHITYDQGAQ